MYIRLVSWTVWQSLDGHRRMFTKLSKTETNNGIIVVQNHVTSFLGCLICTHNVCPFSVCSVSQHCLICTNNVCPFSVCSVSQHCLICTHNVCPFSVCSVSLHCLICTNNVCPFSVCSVLLHDLWGGNRLGQVSTSQFIYFTFI